MRIPTRALLLAGALAWSCFPGLAIAAESEPATPPEVLEDTREDGPPEFAPAADAALAEALERASREGWRQLDLVVECQHDERLEMMRLWGSGVGTWQGSRQFRLPRDEVAAILDELRQGRFADMSPVYGGPPDSVVLPDDATQGARIICRIVLELDGQVKQVAQRKRGEQSAELRRLAGGILHRCRERGLGGVAAGSLADGLAKLAAGTLAPEALRLVVQRRPDGRAAGDAAVSWLLRIEGRQASARSKVGSAGYGEPAIVELDDGELRAIVKRLADGKVGDLPGNLWAEQYTDLLVEVLGHRKSIQARRFAGMEPDTHGAAQGRFDDIFGALRSLSSRILAPAPE